MFGNSPNDSDEELYDVRCPSGTTLPEARRETNIHMLYIRNIIFILVIILIIILGIILGIIRSIIHSIYLILPAIKIHLPIYLTVW